jgi:pimeloyl-ACP methyl ester carboxylesterase
MPHRLQSTVLVFIAFCFSTCSQDKVLPAPILLSAVQLASYDNKALQLVASINDSLVYQPADYKVTVTRISYRTTLKDGSPITASGVIFLPEQTATHKPYPLLSFQHPTAFSNAEIPTGYNYSSASFSYQLYFATHGYIVTSPDYVGYGDASSTPHNYEHEQSLAQATIDMLLATKAYLGQQHITSNDQIFLAGYSEGGYATLSSQKLIEKNYSASIKLAGSSCGAGPYAMPAYFHYITRNTTVGGIANQIYAWQTLSYNRIYGINKPIGYFFKAPFAELISQSLDNARTIPLSFDQICTDEFLADIRDPSSAFSQALDDNDLTKWSTPTATQFIHSEKDEIVPFLTSQQTYASMQRRGSPNLNLIPIKTGGHVPTEVIFMQRSLGWFEHLRK